MVNQFHELKPNFVAARYKASVSVGYKSHSDFTNIMAQLLPGHRE